MNGPYKAARGNDQKEYVDGPGEGLGYYLGTLWASLRFDDVKNAERAAKIANLAYREGYEQAQHDIRKALGIN